MTGTPHATDKRDEEVEGEEKGDREGDETQEMMVEEGGGRKTGKFISTHLPFYLHPMESNLPHDHTRGHSSKLCGILY